MTWEDVVRAHAWPVQSVALSPRLVITAVVAALVLVSVGALWRVVRLAVTLVHELGHATAGILSGRRFTGFVVRGDMSGHAITTGRRGPSLAVTAWAGYPAPAFFAVALVAAATLGWAAPLLSVLIVVLVASIVQIRSVLTAVVVLGSLVALGALWWWRNDTVQAGVLVSLGAILLVGAWRQWGAVARAATPESDPGQLAAITHIPAFVWLASFVVVIAAATVACGWLVGRSVGWIG